MIKFIGGLLIGLLLSLIERHHKEREKSTSNAMIELIKERDMYMKLYLQEKMKGETKGESQRISREIEKNA